MTNFVEYNRDNAIRYAYKWAKQRNPLYYDFTELGGNCTNFVSQALVAGNLPQRYNYPMGWYYKSASNRSPSFTNAHYLAQFILGNASGRGPFGRIVSINDAVAGDIIQFSVDGENFTHSAIITIIDDKGNPLITANTRDLINAPLSWFNFTDAKVIHIEGGRY